MVIRIAPSSLRQTRSSLLMPSMFLSSSSPSLLRRNRDFRYLFICQLLENGAYWFVQIPVLVLLNELTGSGLWGALSLTIGTGVRAALLPFAGTVLDRVDRRRVMAMASVVDIAAAVTLLVALRSSATAWLAFPAMAANAAATAFFMPAAAVALPNLVLAEDLKTANAIAGSAFGIMSILGASASGVLVAIFHPTVSFACTIAALAFVVFLISRIKRPFQSDRGNAETSGTWSAVIDGFRYIVHRPRVRVIVTVKCAGGLSNGAFVIYPLLATSFGLGAIGTGLLFAARGAGLVTGPFLLRKVLSKDDWLLPGLALSMAVFGLSYLAASVAGWFPLMLTLIFIAHMAAGGNWTMSSYALQAEVPDEFRGRLVTADVMLVSLAITGSQLTMGALVDTVNIRILLAACGVLTLLYAVGWRAAAAPGLRPMTRSATTPTHQ
jgi:MFS family permease